MSTKQRIWDTVAKNKLSGNQKDYHPLPILQRLLGEFVGNNDFRVADLGCYNGRDIIEIARMFRSVSFTGYEISPLAVDAAQRLVAENGLEKSIAILQQDIESALQVTDGYFHVSIAKYVLPFIEDKLSFLIEMKRISSQAIIIATPVVSNSGDPNLSERGRSISMEREAFHKIMQRVFGSHFVVREILKDNKDTLVEIEVVTIKIA